MRIDPALLWRCAVAIADLALIALLWAMTPARHGCAGVGHAMTLGCWP
jgi:hypothetical protein